MVWAPCKQGPCCHIQPTLRPGSPSAQAHPFWEINTNLNKVTSTELDLSKKCADSWKRRRRILLPASQTQVHGKEESWNEILKRTFLWILLLWFLLKHKQAQISNIQRPCRFEASHDSNPFFFLNHLSSGKVWWWWRQMLFVIHPTIEWTHCGGGILFGISDDLSKTQLKCCPSLKYFSILLFLWSSLLLLFLCLLLFLFNKLRRWFVDCAIVCHHIQVEAWLKTKLF